MMLLSKFEVLSMLCNIKSLTSWCLTDGGPSLDQCFSKHCNGWRRMEDGGDKVERKRTATVSAISTGLIIICAN